MKPPTSKSMATPSRIPILRGVRKASRTVIALRKRLKRGQDVAQNAVKAHIDAVKTKEVLTATKAVPVVALTSLTIVNELSQPSTFSSAPKVVKNMTPNVTVRKKPQNFCDVLTNVPITPRKTRSGRLLTRRSIFKPVIPDANMARIVTQDEINQSIENIPNLEEIPMPQPILSFSSDTDGSDLSSIPPAVPKLPDIALNFTPPLACAKTPRSGNAQSPVKVDLTVQSTTSEITPPQVMTPKPSKQHLTVESQEVANNHTHLVAESTLTRKTHTTTKPPCSTSPVATHRLSTSPQQPAVSVIATAAVSLPEAMVASISTLDLVLADGNPAVIEERANIAPVTPGDNDVCPVDASAEKLANNSAIDTATNNGELTEITSNSNIEAERSCLEMSDKAVVESAVAMEVAAEIVSPVVLTLACISPRNIVSFPDTTSVENVASDTLSKLLENVEAIQAKNLTTPFHQAEVALPSEPVNIDETPTSSSLVAQTSASDSAEADNSAEMSIIITNEPECDDVEPEPEGNTDLDAAKKELNKKRKDRRNSIFPRQAIHMLKSFKQFDQEMGEEQSASLIVNTEHTKSLDEDNELASPVTKKPRTGKQIRGKKVLAKVLKKEAIAKTPKPPAAEPPKDGFQPRFETEGKIMVAVRVPKANKTGFRKIPSAVELNPLLLVEPSESCLKKRPNESWSNQKRFRWADEAKEGGQDTELAHVHEYDPDYGGFRKSTFQRSMFQLYRTDEEDE